MKLMWRTIPFSLIVFQSSTVPSRRREQNGPRCKASYSRYSPYVALLAQVGESALSTPAQSAKPAATVKQQRRQNGLCWCPLLKTVHYYSKSLLLFDLFHSNAPRDGEFLCLVRKRGSVLRNSFGLMPASSY